MTVQRGDTALTVGQEVRDRNRADSSRRQFSVLCHRGWCDHEFMRRDVAMLISFVTVRPAPVPEQLQGQECPTPDTCQCVCHDTPPAGALAEAARSFEQEG